MYAELQRASSAAHLLLLLHLLALLAFAFPSNVVEVALEKIARFCNLLCQLLIEDIADILCQIVFRAGLAPGEQLQLQLFEPVEAIDQGLDLLNRLLLNLNHRFSFLFLLIIAQNHVLHLKVAITICALLLGQYWSTGSYLDYDGCFWRLG